MAKYQNKYRIESARLAGWDYRNDGAYFITICTHNRLHHFGVCLNGKMKLSTAGIIVQGCWYEIARLNPQVTLGKFVVMPNHIHGILILDDGMDGMDGMDVQTFDSNVSTIDTTDTPPENDHKNEFFQKISPKSGSVSRIIQQYKTACTKHIRGIYPDMNFEWQERFHDHIIRSEGAFQRISHYIVTNAANWDKDTFNDSKQQPNKNTSE